MMYLTLLLQRPPPQVHRLWRQSVRCDIQMGMGSGVDEIRQRRFKVTLAFFAKQMINSKQRHRLNIRLNIFFEHSTPT